MLQTCVLANLHIKLSEHICGSSNNPMPSDSFHWLSHSNDLSIFVNIRMELMNNEYQEALGQYRGDWLCSRCCSGFPFISEFVKFASNSHFPSSRGGTWEYIYCRSQQKKGKCRFCYINPLCHFWITKFPDWCSESSMWRSSQERQRLIASANQELIEMASLALSLSLHFVLFRS